VDGLQEAVAVEHLLSSLQELALVLAQFLVLVQFLALAQVLALVQRVLTSQTVA